MPAGVDQFGELRGGYGEARDDGLEASGVFLEVPDELATGPFARIAASILVNTVMRGPNSVRRTIGISVTRCMRSSTSGGSVSPGPGWAPRNSG